MASITLSFHSEALERTVPLRALVPLEDAPRVPSRRCTCFTGCMAVSRIGFNIPG